MSLSTATPETKSFSFFCSHLLTASCFPSWPHFLFEYCNWCCFNLALLACMCSLFEIVPGLWALLEPPWSGVEVREGSSLRSHLLLWSHRNLSLPHSIWLRSLINCRCIHAALARGRRMETIPPGGMIFGREDGTETGLHKREISCCQ